jgi:hypothetical protein
MTGSDPRRLIARVSCTVTQRIKFMASPDKEQTLRTEVFVCFSVKCVGNVYRILKQSVHLSLPTAAAACEN